MYIKAHHRTLYYIIFVKCTSLKLKIGVVYFKDKGRFLSLHKFPLWQC